MIDQAQEAVEGVKPAEIEIDPVAPVVESIPEKPSIVKTSNWGGKIVLWCGLGSVFMALVGALGSGWGLWQFSVGFQMLMASFGLAAIAILLGLFIGWRQRKRGPGGPKAMRWIGMVASLAMIGWLLRFVYVAQTVPAIHDISTDLADPPQFTQLAVRADNLDNIPGADDGDMRGFSPQQRWETLHKGAYGDIRSVRVNMPVVEVIAKAERLAKDRDWDIAVVSAEEGRIEATETTRFFRFKDDVVVRVRATEDGRGSIVDMRSISRVGVSDLGVNAKRVRSFLADLSGTVSS